MLGFPAPNNVFQSTPVIANGRIGEEVTITGQADMFQSTPVIANGRIQEAVKPIALYRFVSIHARYC